MKAALIGLTLAAIAAGAAWRLSAPSELEPWVIAELAKPGDAKAGERIFWVAGCASCHAARETPFQLAGGLALATPFGKIYAPNISPDSQDGIGGWSAHDLGRALIDGVDDGARHLYPAFPYPSYRNMALKDIRDLSAFLHTLPAVKGRAPEPELAFPYNIRRAVGFWKRLYLKPVQPPNEVAASDSAAYGRYLIQGPGHCGECHTPRDSLGGPLTAKALTGATLPDGKKADDISPTHLAKWSQTDIETALTTGITPDGDVLAGAMAEVVHNLSHLPKSDITAIAKALKGS